MRDSTIANIAESYLLAHASLSTLNRSFISVPLLFLHWLGLRCRLVCYSSNQSSNLSNITADGGTSTSEQTGHIENVSDTEHVAVVLASRLINFMGILPHP